MKKLLISVSALLLTANVMAGDKQYVAGDDSRASKLCVTAATGSNIQMLVKVRDFTNAPTLTGKYKYVSNNVTCNGQFIADFAKEAGNYSIAKKLAKHQKANVSILDLAKVNSGKVDVAIN